MSILIPFNFSHSFTRENRKSLSLYFTQTLSIETLCMAAILNQHEAIDNLCAGAHNVKKLIDVNMS